MALLLNRKYGSRLECLFYILKSCYAKYGTVSTFSLGNIKFNQNDEYNTHKYCKLLIDCVGIKCCPYLVNPLNSSKCYATQSINSDSTKSKAVSDIGGSLEALGFIKKNKNGYKITTLGEKWINSEFYSEEWESIARQGVLSYGPVIGFLYKIKSYEDIFTYSGIYLSYPQTQENVTYVNEKGIEKYINISTDSQRDSNTRTMSRIINWCVTVGLIEPAIKTDSNNNLPAHLRYRDFINSGELVIRKFKKTQICKDYFNKKHFVDNPLSFNRLHKNVGSLRENGGDDLRKATMLYNKNIVSRRFVFVYVLNYFSRKNKTFLFSDLINTMSQYAEKFFSEGNDPYEIMSTESEIAYISGIPFEVKNEEEIIPLTILNDDVLCEDADQMILGLAQKIALELEKKYDI